MKNDLRGTHIQVSTFCRRCGHEWDVDDYDSMSVHDAEEVAREADCPRCGTDKPRQVRFSNIKWDTSNDECDEALDPTDLGPPLEVTLEVDEDLDLDNDGADVLSDRFGFCVFGFEYEVET